MISRFEFSDKDFRFICELVAREAGIKLNDGKKELVYGRLAKRLRILELETFSQYCDVLKDEHGDEVLHCVNAITTNVTAFFRENHHFDFMHNNVLPELTATSKQSGKRDLNIWSAGCSTGQEPYSIAMNLCEFKPTLDGWNIKILATDLDSVVLEQARSGIYRIDLLENVSLERRKQFFLKGTGANEGSARIIPQIQNMIKFKYLNLIEPWDIGHGFDVIFCRNVMIYFDKDMRQRLLLNFAQRLSPNGFLFVGHSESLSGISDVFQPAGTTIYRKVK
jgi:chemotaxis protein methyltransferase CheR